MNIPALMQPKLSHVLQNFANPNLKLKYATAIVPWNINKQFLRCLTLEACILQQTCLGPYAIVETPRCDG